MSVSFWDEEGNFIVAFSYHDNDSFTAQAKAWGLYMDFEWVALMGYNKVIFENDCKMVVDNIHNNKPNHYE
jgi:hypothetical protein